MYCDFCGKHIQFNPTVYVRSEKYGKIMLGNNGTTYYFHIDCILENITPELRMKLKL